MDRRTFNAGFGAALVATALPARAAADYRGPNVILVRFGGGVRRAETIDEAATWAPYLRHELAPRGTFIPDVMIEQLDGVDTSHAEGTLNLLTGRYLGYRDAGSRGLADRLEPTEPTLFEYLRAAHAIPSHRALLINGEDRPQEEFFTSSVSGHYGIAYKSEMLSLHRFKIWRTERALGAGGLTDEAEAELRGTLDKLLAADPRGMAPDQPAEIGRFWERWATDYGTDGFRNPRGDRLLTELAVRALGTLQPRLMMVNYQDPDYVHWGNPSHYTRAIQIIDEGLRRLVSAVEADPFYRGNTVFVITPDCGRDANPLMEVPFQHHFNSRTAHETWAVIFGTGVRRGTLDRRIDQTAFAPTVGALMGFRAEAAEGRALEEIFA